jgi:hypothetical protein
MLLEPPGGTLLQCRDELRLATRELGGQQVADQLVVAVPLAATIQRDHGRFDDSSTSSVACDPDAPSTASQRGPHSCSSTEVRVRKDTSPGGRRASTSVRRWSAMNTSSPRFHLDLPARVQAHSHGGRKPSDTSRGDPDVSSRTEKS